MREEVLASAGAQDMDTSGYELSVLEDNDIFRDNPQVELNAVFIPGIVTPFSPTALNDLELGEGGSSEKTLVLVEEEEKENSLPTTPVSECHTELPRLRGSCPFGRQIEITPKFFL